jgi:hypothetical protein
MSQLARSGAKDAVAKAQPDQLRASGGSGARLARESARPPLAVRSPHSHGTTAHQVRHHTHTPMSGRRGAGHTARLARGVPCLLAHSLLPSPPLVLLSAAAGLAAVDLLAMATTRSDARRVSCVAPCADALSRARASVAARCRCILQVGGHLDWWAPRAALARGALLAIVTTGSDARRGYRVASRADDLSRARASTAVRYCCILGAGGHLDWSTPRAALAGVALLAIATTRSDARRVSRVASRADALSRACASAAVHYCCIPGAGGHLDWWAPRAALARVALLAMATTGSDACRDYRVASCADDLSRARASVAASHCCVRGAHQWLDWSTPRAALARVALLAMATTRSDARRVSCVAPCADALSRARASVAARCRCILQVGGHLERSTLKAAMAAVDRTPTATAAVTAPAAARVATRADALSRACEAMQCATAAVRHDCDDEQARVRPARRQLH